MPDIILKNKLGQDVVYSGINKLRFFNDSDKAVEYGLGSEDMMSKYLHRELETINFKGSRIVPTFQGASVTSISGDDIETIVGDATFIGCGRLTNISFPNLKSMGSSTFYACSSLKSVDLPKLELVPSYAFGSCYNLETAHFQNASRIEEYAFYIDSNLRYVSAPSASYIGKSAFFNCFNLSEASFDNVT